MGDVGFRKGKTSPRRRSVFNRFDRRKRAEPERASSTAVGKGKVERRVYHCIFSRGHFQGETGNFSNFYRIFCIFFSNAVSALVAFRRTAGLTALNGAFGGGLSI